jgi:hypothetical protein
MQFPVPQFTDVEDRLIGSLTFKQFGIIFGAGIIVFLFYSITKSIGVLIFFGIIVGLPAIGLAFAKINGRPLYKYINHFIKFFTAPKVLVFHKESVNFSDASSVKEAEVASAAVIETKTAEETQSKIREINRLLERQAEEERLLVRKNTN